MSVHRNCHFKVAAFRYQPAHSIALRSDYDSQRAIKIRVPDIGSAVCRCSVYPDSIFFQFFYCGSYIRNPGHRHIFNRTGRCLAHNRRNTGTAPFWNYNAVCPCAFSRPYYCAEIMMIGYLIAYNYKRRLIFFPGCLEYLLYGNVAFNPGKGHNPLMCSGF